MASVLSLFVHGWVPIGIIEYNIAGACKVKSYSSWSCAANKAEHSGIVVKSFYDCLSEFCFCVAIESDIVELEHVQYFLENV